MNLRTVISLAAVAVGAFAGAARADACDTTALATLLASTDVTQCSTDSGYDFTSLATPSEDEMALMCTSTSCQSALASAESLGLSDCTVSSFSIETGLIEPVVAYCAGSTSASAETGTSSSSTADEDVAATVSPGGDSSSSTDSEIVATVEPVVANTTSSASADTDTEVGDSDSGSDFTVETPEPTSADSSASEETEESASASASSSGSDTEASSGSNAGTVVTHTTAVLGSAIAATVVAFIL